MYIPKVILHTNVSNKDTIYVFIGILYSIYPEVVEKLVSNQTLTKSDNKHIQGIIGDQWKTILLINQPNVIYLNETLKPNDNINIFRKKVAISLGIAKTSYMYIWYKRYVHNDPSIIYNFINNIFKKSSTLRSEVFQNYISSYFGLSQQLVKSVAINKKDAIKLLFGIKDMRVTESLCFQYTYDGYVEYFNADPTTISTENGDAPIVFNRSLNMVSSLPLLLNNFMVENDTFHIIEKTKTLSDLYFPFDDVKITDDDKALIDLLEKQERHIDTLKVPKDIVTSTIINYVSIKSHSTNSRVNLDTLFNIIEATSAIPFMKYKTPMNVFYKIHRKSLPLISQDDISTWTKTPSTKDDKSVILLKIVFNNTSYCTLTINMDLSYSVKINISMKDGESIQSIHDFIPSINTFIDIIVKTYPDSYVPLLPRDILYTSRENDVVYVDQIISSSTVKTKSTKINYDILPSIVKTQMFTYFNVIENADKSILHLQYKKVNNYAKFTNISSFISGNYMMPREDLIKKVELMFMIPHADAEQEVDSWFASHTMELEMNEKNKGKIYFKNRSDSLVNVKIKLKSAVDFKYMVNGITSMEVSDEIEGLIKKMILLSGKDDNIAKLGNKIESKIDKIEKIGYVDSVVSFEGDSEKDANSDQDFDDKSDSDSDASDTEEDEDMKAILMGFQKELTDIADKGVDKGIVKEEKVVATDGKPKKIKGYVLNKLYEADISLFDYQVPPDIKRRDYASVCGWVDRRQPVVVTEDEVNNINKNYPGAINGFVKSGSTAELQKKNHYICPKIWCPVSRVALSYDDYVKYGEKCPFPDVAEEPILFATKSFFGEGETGLKKERYPGFLDKSIHPDKLCLPCCFKVKPDKGNRNKKRGDQCIPKDLDNTNSIPEEQDINMGKEKYVLGTNSFPLEMGRYGLLPQQLVEWFDQLNKQGNRHDGTGSMTDKTDAIFRKGVLLSKQSYGEALITVLDNPEIKNASQLYRVIHDNIDIITYISLENGRIMKMFIDTSKTVYDKDSFQAFYDWFKTQKKYILHMNLSRLLKEIEDAGKVFNNLQHYHEVLREYIIYQSFMNFKQYLLNDRIAKEHLVLSDLVSNHLYKYVNVHRYNIVHLEYNADNEKIYFHCNVNRESPYNLNYPFVFLMKRHVFYEPLIHIKIDEGSIVMTPKFTPTFAKMREIITFVSKNCITSKSQSAQLPNLFMFLKGIDYKVKYTVIDYGYKTCGLLLNHNLYLPLMNREDIYYDENVRYVYINDVPRFKCMLGKEDVKDVYEKVGNYMKQDYSISRFLEEKGKVLGFQMKHNQLFVPMNISMTSNMSVTFQDGLFVFIGHEKQDRRVELYKRFAEDNEKLTRMVKDVKNKINNDDDMRAQVTFLLDKNNPLPLVYKKQKLEELLKSLNSQDKIDDKYIYKLYSALNKHSGLYQRRTRRFVHGDEELLLDHSDVLAGRLKEEIDFAENPHKAFLDVVDDIENVYIFDEMKEVSYEDIINKDMFEDVPTKWRKILKGFSVIDNEGCYNQKYIYNIFQKISDDITKGNGFKDDLYYISYKNKIVTAFASGNTGEILSNPWIEQHFKKLKEVPTLDKVLEVHESPLYYPSLFDIRVMAQLAGLNLVLIGRKTQKNPDGLEVLYNNSDFFIILLYMYDRHNVLDVFQVFCDGKKIYFKAGELPADFKDILNKKMKTYNVEVEDDNV